MKKAFIIILAAFGLLVVGLGGYIFFGLMAMQIEDTYGDNQDIFYQSREGDLVVNHDTQELGQISKTWTTFKIMHHTETLDISEWWDDKNIEIWRSLDEDISLVSVEYEDVYRLKREGRIERIKSLR